MFMIFRRLILHILIAFALFHPCIIYADSVLNVQEVLSINIGKGPDNIGNQFKGMGVNLDPFNGFVFDSKGNILISDTRNHRIMRFSKGAKSPDLFTISNDVSLFFPDSLCLTGDDTIFTHNPKQGEIINFSSNGKHLKSYAPSVNPENKRKHAIISSITCGKETIKIVFSEGSYMKDPVYQDEYNQDFRLISRKIYDNKEDYNNALREINKLFEKHFEDSKGNMYGYPFEKTWYGKFLPLQKYSSQEVLLFTIDGNLLTEKTKYKVYDYYTMKPFWIELKGSEFLIVNWYVIPSGVIYVLLANNDYVKVLRIDE